MRALLLRPRSPNERFGLGPFFRLEPLGPEYVAASLLSSGHEAAVYDLRFSPAVERLLRRHRPDLVGIACAHTLDTPEVLKLALRVKAFDPSLFTLVGGHAAAVYPEPLHDPAVDGLCLEDGERVVPDLAEALERKRSLREIPGLQVRADRRDPACREFLQGPPSPERIPLDAVPLPARQALATSRRRYLCVQRSPVHLLETSRGCPYRCRFCTVWQHVDRTFRFRSPEWVRRDMESVGRNVFIADDLFWYPPERSLDLARALRRRGIRKDWILVQSRTDLAARHPEVLEAWRPLAAQFDIFFGFEAPSTGELKKLSKECAVGDIEEAVRVCRRLGFGITGNFIADLDWGEREFERLWEFTDRLSLDHVGFTILTPLPGTRFFEESRHRIRETDWSRYDMHHILWEPAIGRERFLELFAETWRRSALRVRGARHLLSYLRQVRPSRIPFLLKVLHRSRRLYDARAYLSEAFPRDAVASAPGVGRPAGGPGREAQSVRRSLSRIGST